MFLAGIQSLVSSLSDNPSFDRLLSTSLCYAQDRRNPPYQGDGQPSYPTSLKVSSPLMGEDEGEGEAFF